MPNHGYYDHLDDGPAEKSEKDDLLVVTLPSHSQDEGFKLMVGDDDLTKKLSIKKVTTTLEAGQPLMVTLECYAKRTDLEALPSGVTVITL